MRRHSHSEKLAKLSQQSEPYTFIVTSSTAPRSRKSYEAQQAEAKSHAARVTHRKRTLASQHKNTALIRDDDNLARWALVVSDYKKTSRSHHATSPYYLRPAVARGVAQFPSPLPGFGCFREELVSIFPSVDQPHVSSLLDFWCHILNPGNDLVTEFFNITNPYPLFLPLMSNPVFYHVGFGVVWSVLQRELDPTAPPSHLTQLHRGLAVARVREQLERGQEVAGMAAAIIWLAVLEFAVGARDESQLHLQGLSAYIARIGGINMLSKDERAFVSHFESSLALLTSRGSIVRPKQSHLRFNPSFDIFLIPGGFRALLCEQEISSDVIELLMRAVKVNMDLDSTLQNDRRRAARHESRRYYDCIEACPVLIAPDSELNVISKMICFSLLLYCSLNSPTRVLFGWGKASQFWLKSKVGQRDPSTKAERKFFIWVYMLLIHAYRGGCSSGAISDELRGLLDKLHQQLGENESQKWSNVEAILKDFFWPSQLSKNWKSSWDQLSTESPSSQHS